MKIAILTLIVGLMIAMPAVGSSPLNSGQATEPQSRAKAIVRLAVTTADVRETRDLRTDVLLLWNRQERTTPIGHGVKSCVKIGHGGILGGGLWSCQLTLVLPLGKVSAAGVVHSVYRYTLVVNGGTGVYEGTSGALFVRRVADGVRQMTFGV